MYTNPIQLSVAPMMGFTNRHFRYLMRLICPGIHLYSEMVTTGALLHGEKALQQRLLAFHPKESPVALQLGGSNPEDLAVCARMAEELGYQEVNLNVGCPSSRVQSGSFGACLLKEPKLTADCVRSMKEACTIPVTVKTRIGVDEYDSWEHLCHFTQNMVDAGCDALFVHARKAWLKGLNPKQNRCVPPLHYDCVYRLKETFPDLPMTINGGIKTVADAVEHLNHVDGVMIGRAAYEDTGMLVELAHALANKPVPDLSVLIQPYIDYIIELFEAELNTVLWSDLIKGILGLIKGKSGAKALRNAVCMAGKKNASERGAVLDGVLAFLAA